MVEPERNGDVRRVEPEELGVRIVDSPVEEVDDV